MAILQGSGPFWLGLFLALLAGAIFSEWRARRQPRRRRRRPPRSALNALAEACASGRDGVASLAAEMAPRRVLVLIWPGQAAAPLVQAALTRAGPRAELSLVVVAQGKVAAPRTIAAVCAIADELRASHAELTVSLDCSEDEEAAWLFACSRRRYDLIVTSLPTRGSLDPEAREAIRAAAPCPLVLLDD